MTVGQEPKTPTHWGRAILGVLLGFLLIGCFIAAYTGIDLDFGGRPGAESEYDSIDSLTDCQILQGRFDMYSGLQSSALRRHDTDAAEINLSYMAAVDERMQELGC
ncbi:MAG TPA: hypothetical protein VF174_15835 [Micromonosporaceae bacterium]